MQINRIKVKKKFVLKTLTQITNRHRRLAWKTVLLTILTNNKKPQIIDRKVIYTLFRTIKEEK